jgi:hypothetical protein
MDKLKILIEKIVSDQFSLLMEKDDTAMEAEPVDAAEPDMDFEGGDDIAGGLEDLAGDVDLDTASDAEGLEGEDGLEGDEDGGMEDFGGGSGGFGGGGGGGGFGSGGLSFDDDSEDSDSETGSEDENSEQQDQFADLSADPVLAVVEAAKEMRKRTGDSQQILNNVKAGIQEKFANFDDAGAVIEMLWDTQEPVLQVVARKLILFIKGN